MKEKVTPHIKQLQHLPSIENQYFIKDTASIEPIYNDPLMEDSHEVTKGLIHKYDNRGLIKVSYECAAHCRFCTRIRQIGNRAGRLTEIDMDNIIQYLKKNPQINDVILSGGDPFLTPKITFPLIEKLEQVDSIKIIRIGTRLPLQQPISFYSKSIEPLLKRIYKINQSKVFHLLIHVNHPDELTETVLETLSFIKKETGAVMFSQSVFLRGINDNYETLHTLFNTLYFNGILPYYLYHCDKVKGLEDFEVPLDIEIEIVKQLRQNLSGLACPTFVVDIENGFGKIPVDLNML